MAVRSSDFQLHGLGHQDVHIVFGASRLPEQPAHEAETLRAQVVACREEAYEMRARTAAEEEIVEAVRRERASQAEQMADLRNSERDALEQNQVGDLRERLENALSQVNRLEGTKQNALEDLRSLQTELQEAREKSEELSKAEIQLERAHHEQVQALQQQAVLAQNAARDREEEHRKKLDHVQKEAQEASQSSEKTWELRLQEKERACEMQTSIAEDQERNIRHLESLLKEQGDQLTKERTDHMRGLDQLRASASLSESKTCLLQEQVVALRQQLQRRQFPHNTPLNSSSNFPVAERNSWPPRKHGPVTGQLYSLLWRLNGSRWRCKHCRQLAAAVPLPVGGRLHQAPRIKAQALFQPFDALGTDRDPRRSWRQLLCEGLP
eukprot:s220_g3.t1